MRGAISECPSLAFDPSSIFFCPMKRNEFLDDDWTYQLSGRFQTIHLIIKCKTFQTLLYQYYFIVHHKK